MDRKVSVLLSGGIDSTACIEYYLSHGYNASALFVEYGQPQVELERNAANAVADHYSIILKHVAVSGCLIPEGYIPARNALLLSLALMNLENKPGLVAIGIHAGTTYSDCSPEFRDSMQHIFDLYEQGQVRIDAPFLHWSKSEIWDYAQLHNVPLHLTYSNNLNDLRPVADHLRASN